MGNYYYVYLYDDVILIDVLVFFFKQKTAYEMRISDWSSDVCSSDLPDFDDRAMALQEMFAATLFKIAPRYQRAFLLYGRAGKGKTQILKVLRAMLHTNAVAELGPERWGENFTIVDLIDKAANICGEIQIGRAS